MIDPIPDLNLQRVTSNTMVQRRQYAAGKALK